MQYLHASKMPFSTNVLFLYFDAVIFFVFLLFAAFNFNIALMSIKLLFGKDSLLPIFYIPLLCFIEFGGAIR